MQIYLMIILLWSASVHGGCYQRRLCCPGRNMSCVGVETGSRNVFNAEFASKHRNRVIEAVTAQSVDINDVITDKPVRSRNWHVHVPDMKLMDDERIENFTQWLYEHNNHEHRQDADELDHPKFEHMKLPMFDPADLTDQSGFYDDVASGGEFDGNFSGVTFFDSQHEITDAPDRKTNKDEGIRYELQEGAKYEILHDDVDKIDKRKKSTTKIDFNGKTKEISYVIFSDSLKEAFPQMTGGDEKFGFLKDDSHDCYCDEECRLLNDCCSDFVDTCPSSDCEVSPWSGWGHCQTGDENEITRDQCGPGISKRVRTVVEGARLGGVACPHLVEQKSCYNTDAHGCGQLASEVALLLLYKYSSAREPGYKNNIYYDLPKTLTKLSSMTSYCSIFDVHWLNSHCQDAETKRQLRPGAKVCVECQPAAQKSDSSSPSSDRCTGHGMIGTKTLWSLISAKSCFGQWILEKKVEHCECQKDYPSYFKFIFV